MSHLTPYYNQPVVQDLVTGLLTACPDQIRFFLQNVGPYLTPRETPKWIDNAGFLCKVSYSDLMGLRIVCMAV